MHFYKLSSGEYEEYSETFYAHEKRFTEEEFTDLLIEITKEGKGMEAYGFILVEPTYTAHFTDRAHLQTGADIEFERQEVGRDIEFSSRTKYFVAPRREESPQPLIHRMTGVDVYLGEDTETGTFIGKIDSYLFKGDKFEVDMETGPYAGKRMYKVLKNDDIIQVHGGLQYRQHVMFVREVNEQD